MKSASSVWYKDTLTGYFSVKSRNVTILALNSHASKDSHISSYIQLSNLSVESSVCPFEWSELSVCPFEWSELSLCPFE